MFLPRYPGGYPSSRILLSHGGGSSSCITTERTIYEDKILPQNSVLDNLVIVHHT